MWTLALALLATIGSVILVQPTAAMAAGSCGLTPQSPSITTGSFGLLASSGVICSEVEPNITTKLCLNHQIFLFVWSGDEFCKSVSEELEQASFVSSNPSVPTGRTYRAHVQVSFVPPGGQSCSGGCFLEAWSNGVNF